MCHSLKDAPIHKPKRFAPNKNVGSVLSVERIAIRYCVEFDVSYLLYLNIIVFESFMIGHFGKAFYYGNVVVLWYMN